MSNIILLHSLLRYFIIIFALVVVVLSLTGMMRKKKFKKTNKQTALVLLICCDLQLLLGLALYHMGGWLGKVQAKPISRDVAVINRFYGMEHAVSMIIAIVLVHAGYSVTKKNMDDDRKFKRLFWTVFVALMIFIAMTPWQSRQLVGRPNVPQIGS